MGGSARNIIVNSKSVTNNKYLVLHETWNVVNALGIIYTESSLPLHFSEKYRNETNLSIARQNTQNPQPLKSWNPTDVKHLASYPHTTTVQCNSEDSLLNFFLRYWILINACTYLLIRGRLILQGRLDGLD